MTVDSKSECKKKFSGLTNSALGYFEANFLNGGTQWVLNVTERASARSYRWSGQVIHHIK